MGALLKHIKSDPQLDAATSTTAVMDPPHSANAQVDSISQPVTPPEQESLEDIKQRLRLECIRMLDAADGSVNMCRDAVKFQRLFDVALNKGLGGSDPLTAQCNDIV